MKRLVTLLFSLCLVFALLGSAQAALIFVSQRAPLGGNDFVDWGALGAAIKTVNNPFDIVSTRGLSINVSMTPHGYSLRRVDRWSGTDQVSPTPFMGDNSFAINQLDRITVGISPENPSIQNGATNVSIRPQFAWQAVNGATSYDLYLWKDGETKPIAPTIKDISGAKATLADPLSPLITYRWQVIARNTLGQTQGPEWTFTTGNILLGDVNDDKAVNLLDVILTFQAIGGLNPVGIRAYYTLSGADVNGDGRIGLTEAIYTLQKVAGIRQDTSPGGAFTLTSTAFTEGATIPMRYTYNLAGQCSGENVSPALAWANPPANAKSFAITMHDPDGGNWVHWVQFNIPAGMTSLAEGAGGPDVGVKGLNDFGDLGYGGPCPPSGNHHYIFTLYALDAALSLTQGATRGQVNTAMTGHILGQATLTGRRSYGN